MTEQPRHLRAISGDGGDAPPTQPPTAIEEAAQRTLPRRRGRRVKALLPTSRHGWLSAAPRILILVAVSSTAAFLVGPRLVASDLPTEDEVLGKPARSAVEADRDYILIDEAATAQRRDDAARLSRSVWDLDLARGRADAAALQKGLVRLSLALEPLRRQVEKEAAEKEATERDAARKARLDLHGQQIAAAVGPVRAILAGELATVGVEAPRDEEWNALVRAVWADPATVDVVTSRVGDALAEPIVGDRTLLVRDEPKGVVIRSVPVARGGPERVISDLAQIFDVKMARQAVVEKIAKELVAAPYEVSRQDAAAIGDLAASLVRTTLSYDAAESDLRRRLAAEQTPPEIIRAYRGETVLRAQEMITPRHLALLRAMAAQQGQQMRTRAALGTGSFVMLLCAVVYLFGARRVFRRSLRTRDLVFLSTLLVLALSFIVAADALNPVLQRRFPALPTQALFLAVPLAFGAMQARLTLTSDVALLFSIVFALLGGVVVDPGMTWAITAVLASLTGAAGVAQSTRGSKVILAGLGAGVVATGASITLELFRGTLVGTQLLWLAAACMVGGFLSGVLAVSFTPVFEAVFGFVTDMKLRRLSDLNQPLLKELIVHAPGTWHHSIRTAVLAEQAAIAVGGSALLARTMALYHDVGKMKSPQWFGENQKGDNPHDRAPPSRSVEALRSHVQEGLELARKHRLPRAVSVAIEEHHGDDLMEGFYLKAVSAAAEEADGPQQALVEEKAYRYTGRLPQTKESAVVMLADHIEAASRGLKDPTPDRLCDLVDAFIARALADDALSDCELSMRDLSRVRDAFQRGLLRIFQAVPDDDASIPPGEGGDLDALRAPRR